MNALYILIPAICVLAIAYRYYCAFLAARVAVLDDSAGHAGAPPRRRPELPSATSWVLFGHHFAAITGAGPLIGPVLAAQFGFLPGASLDPGRRRARRRGARLRDPVGLDAARTAARSPRSRATRSGPVAGFVAAVAILFIVVIALAGLGIVGRERARRERVGHVHHRRAPSRSRSLMGLYMYALARPGASREATVVRRGAAARSRWSPARGSPRSSLAPWSSTLSRESARRSRSPPTASSPRCCRCGCCSARATTCRPSEDRHDRAARRRRDRRATRSSQMPAVNALRGRRRADRSGQLFPFVFISIACGAISGFHALVARRAPRRR